MFFLGVDIVPQIILHSETKYLIRHLQDEFLSLEI